MSGTAALQRSQALRDVGRALATDPAHVTPAQWYRQLDEARRLGDAADDLARNADDLRASSRSVPLKLGGGLAVAGIAYDIHSGKDPVHAVTAGGVGFAAAVATGALIGTAIPVPVVGTVAGAVVGAGVGIFTSGMVDGLFEDGPDVGAAASRGWEAVTDTGRAVAGAPAALAGTVSGWFD